MRNQLAEALQKHDVEYADIRLEDTITSHVQFQGHDLDSIGSSREMGGIARALYKGGWGYATFNNLSDLPRRVAQACESARLVGKGQSQFAKIEPVVDEIHPKLVSDFREVPLSHKKAMSEEYNKLVMGYHPKIQTSVVGYGDKFRHTWFASSEGAYIEEEDPQLFTYAIAVARDGDNVQQAIEWKGGSEGFHQVEGFHDQAEAAARKAIELLDAPPVTGGTYTVIMDPFMTGVFIHEAFGHLSEADFIYENPRMKELMPLGKRFGADILNVIDDGSLPGHAGTHRYDFEGTPTRKNYLIQDGILVGRLHSRETAAKMGEQPTGNARSVSYQHPPIVRMTNTYVDRGSSTLEDMVSATQDGLLVIKAYGGQTELEMFTFSAAYAYRIRNGQVAELVRDVVLTGNVFETLMNIDMISDTVEFEPDGPGGCGKGGQFPLRVGLGGPYVRVQNVVVGGR